MSQLSNLPRRDLALLIALLDEQSLSLVLQAVDLLGEQPNTINADIVGEKRSQPISMAHLVEQATILKTLGYQLREFDSTCRSKCTQCTQQTLVNLIYQKRNHASDTHEFELCMSCYAAVRLFSIYAPAEEKEV